MAAKLPPLLLLLVLVLICCGLLWWLRPIKRALHAHGLAQLTY